MRKFLLPGVLLACLLTGCVDARVKRASSLSKVKVDVAKEEFDKAKTDADKVKVAGDYFETAPKLIGAVDDYLHGREPVEEPNP